jgi:hypothetical protein
MANAQQMKALQLDRWLLNHVFQRQRIFSVDLDQCWDGFGSQFGATQGHFLVQALAAGPDRSRMAEVLKEHYASHPIKSFNQTVCRDLGDPAGQCYFLPWESGRIRPLERFLHSHKIGPTPDEALDPILDRLVKVLDSIQRRGLRQVWRWDGYVRLLRFINNNNQEALVVRDGNHRLATLSFLGHATTRACWEADHWRSSKVFRLGAQLMGRAIPREFPATTVRESEADQWPHVRSGLISVEEAQLFFQRSFAGIWGQP